MPIPAPAIEQELLKAEVPVAVGVHEVACLILCSSESRLRALREPVLFDTMSKTAAIIAGECAVDTFFVGRFLGFLAGVAAADGVGAPQG